MVTITPSAKVPISSIPISQMHVAPKIRYLRSILSAVTTMIPAPTGYPTGPTARYRIELPILSGEVVLETYTGSLGPSARAVGPVRADDGKVLGLVAVGVKRCHRPRPLPSGARAVAGRPRGAVAGRGWLSPGISPAAPPDARPRAGRAGPVVRVPRRGAARGARGSGAPGPAGAPAAGQRRGAQAARAAGRLGRAQARRARAPSTHDRGLGGRSRC